VLFHPIYDVCGVVILMMLSGFLLGGLLGHFCLVVFAWWCCLLVGVAWWHCLVVLLAWWGCCMIPMHW